jgi:hypothetical protein
MQAGSSRHRRGPARRHIALTAVAVVASLGAGAVAFDAMAQDGGPSGIRLSLGIDQRFSHDSNRGLSVPRVGSTTAATSRLNFGLTSETRSQRLAFSAGTNARAVRLPGGTTETTLDEPRYSLSYSRESARSLVSLSGNYSSDRIRFLRPLEDFVTELLDPDGNPVLGPDDEPILIIDLPDDFEDLEGVGRREAIGLNGRLVLGRGGPLVTTLTAGLQERRYTDASIGLTDTRRVNLGASFAARLSPVTSATLRLGFSTFRNDNDDQTRRETKSVNLGINHAVSERLGFSASIGPTRVETREGGVTRRQDGIDVSVGMNYDLPNGAVGASLSTRTNQDGTRTSFSISRSMAFPRASVSSSLGVTRSPGGDLFTTASLSYRHPLPRGNFTLALNRGIGTDANDNDVARTALSMGLSHQINALSSVNFNASLASRDDGSDDRASLSATYRQQFTEDWGVNLGYRYDTRDRAGGRAANHGVFLSLSRSFDIGL